MGTESTVSELLDGKKKLSRRNVLRLATFAAGSAVVGTLLAACGGSSSNDKATQPATSATAPASSTGAASGGATAPAAATTAGGASTPAATVAPPPSAGSGPDPAKMAADQVIRIANLEPQKVDPNLTASGNEVQVVMLLFDGLLAFDRDANALPLCAEKWEISADGLDYTFKMRSGVTWSDGSKVTAKDFEYSFKRLVDPVLASEYAQSAFPITGAEDFFSGKSTDASTIGVSAVDESTLTLKMTGPAAYFLAVLATWNFMPIPKAAVDKFAEKWVEAGNIVTNGMYTMTSWKHDQSIVLDINKDYWGEKPYLTRVEYVITPDPSATSVAAFENNELDVTYPVPAGDVDRIRGDAKLGPQFIKFLASGSTFILYDCANKNSPASNPDVRNAMYLAIDREKLVSAGLKNLYDPAPLMTPPGIKGRNEAAIPKGGPDEARKLLEKAGYPGGKGFPSMTLTWPVNPNYDLAAQIIQQMWKDELGIDVTLQRMEAKAHRAFFGSLSDENIHYDFYIWGWGSDYEDPYNWFNLLWESSQDFYRTRWKNDQYDKLVQDAAVELDTDKRTKLYEQSEVILMQDMPVVPLHYAANNFLVRSTVKDMVWRRVANERFLHKVWISKE
ncbi:MAG: peptide ABC transporter substrate-binding protein [Thermomicrobiales bacterium]